MANIGRRMAPDAPTHFNILKSLSRLGVLVSVDDFGTGYSSMCGEVQLSRGSRETQVPRHRSKYSQLTQGGVLHSELLNTRVSFSDCT
jgi:hypothetical protein